MDNYSEVEKIFDLKLAVIHEKLDTQELRLDKIVGTTKWILATAIIPFVTSIFLLILSKVI